MMKIAENISWKLLQDKIVAVNVETGVYYTMNATAGIIWQAIADEKSKEEIALQLQQTYPDVAREDIAADMNEQINYWKAEKLIV